jgi:hypothetical protein
MQFSMQFHARLFEEAPLSGCRVIFEKYKKNYD